MNPVSMNNKEAFSTTIREGYQHKGASMVLGGAMLDGRVVEHLSVSLPLATLNRHGLIAGATGTGKTKTLQVIAEQLSTKGIPVLLMDIKGDLSGLAALSEGGIRIAERHKEIGIPFQPASFPVEFLSLSHEKGVRLRATVTEFGPVLFSKILGLNDTQSGVMTLVFKYCDDHHLPLVDLGDVRRVLQFLMQEGKADLEAEYGSVASTTAGAILRKIVELEQQGADLFFGEPSFEVGDLCRVDQEGRGIISILRLGDIQDRPKLFSTFMLQLLAEIYSSFPEQGDLDQPRLVFFIDEAHLIFKESSKALLDQIEIIVKLIRSKGVGLIFCTQNPSDIPETVLAQLGLKIQHALRAFTAKDRKAIRLASENYPDSPFYTTHDLMTRMGIGEALVSALNEKGIPTPLAHVMLRAPQSRMDILSEAELEAIMGQSPLASRYNRRTDRESAREILDRKMQLAESDEHRSVIREQEKKAGRPERGFLEELVRHPTARSIGNTIARELTRGIFGVLGLGGSSRRKPTTRR